MCKEQISKVSGWFYIAYFVACFGYVLYEAYSHTGLYRLAAEWQMSTLGEYSEKAAVVASLGMLLILGAIPVRLLGLDPKPPLFLHYGPRASCSWPASC